MCEAGYFGIMLGDPAAPDATAAPNMLCHPGSAGELPHIRGLFSPVPGEPTIPLFMEPWTIPAALQQNRVSSGLPELHFCNPDCTPLSSSLHKCDDDDAVLADAPEAVDCGSCLGLLGTEAQYWQDPELFKAELRVLVAEHGDQVVPHTEIVRYGGAGDAQWGVIEECPGAGTDCIDCTCNPEESDSGLCCNCVGGNWTSCREGNTGPVTAALALPPCLRPHPRAPSVSSVVALVASAVFCPVPAHLAPSGVSPRTAFLAPCMRSSARRARRAGP